MQKQTSRSQKGQSLIEFALFVTTLLILFSGVIDVGRAVISYYMLKDAAEEGAVYGSVCPISSYVVNRTKGSLNSFRADELTVNVSCNGGSCGDGSSVHAGDTIEVDVTYNMALVTPFGPLFFPSNVYTIKAVQKQIVLTEPDARQSVCTP